MVSDRTNQRILVVRVGALGDTLMATPVIGALRSVYPSSEIDFLASEAALPLIRHDPDLRQVFGLRQRNIPALFSPEKWTLVRSLRRNRYDLAIVLESAHRYHSLVQAAHCQKIRGFEGTPINPDQHSSANNIRVAGIEDWENFSLAGRLFLLPEDTGKACRRLESLPKPRIGIHAGYGPSRRKRNQAERLKGWSPQNFGAVIQQLQRAGASVILTGSSADRPLVKEIAATAHANQLLDLSGLLDVRETAAVISQLDLLISVDSGPAHIAAAAGTPLIVLWGPAKLHQVRPISNGAPVQIIRNSVPCAPCYDTPAMKTCRKNICMQLIPPAAVWREAASLLGLTST